MSSLRTRWKLIADRESKARDAVFNARPLSHELQVRAVKEAAGNHDTPLAETIRGGLISRHRGSENPRAGTASILAERVRSLFELFQLQPDARGYRRLLLLLLAECEVRSPEREGQKRLEIAGLRRSRFTQSPEERRTGYPENALARVRALTNPECPTEPLSTRRAIAAVVKAYNAEADIDDILAPDRAPHHRTSEAALKKALQRACVSGKPIQREISSEDPPMRPAVEAGAWHSILEKAAPRADPWVDEIAAALERYRGGRCTAEACAAVAEASILRHLHQQENVSQ